MDAAADLYLDLMKRCLTRSIFADEDYNEVVLDREGWQRLPAAALASLLRTSKVRLIHRDPPNQHSRSIGRDRPQHGETMVGRARLDNLQMCVETALRDEIRGDLIETGVWRGGASILMRAVLAAHNDLERTVWVADSFAGLPPPNAAKYPDDKGIDLWKVDGLAVGLEEVRQNFARYGLLDDQVRFLQGWFSETLRAAPIDEIAVARLDGDLYESTIDALNALYPKLSVGGFLIVDDYGTIPACRKAVHDYRDDQGITEDITDIDGWGAYWRRLQ